MTILTLHCPTWAKARWKDRAVSPLIEAAAFARGLGLHFLYVVQSKNQVHEEYKGQGGASLLENARAEIIFGTNDPGLCKEASERAGYDTVDAVSHSDQRFFAFFDRSIRPRTSKRIVSPCSPPSRSRACA